MKLKKVMALVMVGVMAFSFVGCSKDKKEETKTETTTTTEDTATTDDAAATEETETTETETAATGTDFQSLVLGETGKDLNTTIKWLTHRTDLVDNGKLNEYIAKFNEMYPNIKVEAEGVTNYADDALLRLSNGDWGDIMMIPAVDKKELQNYFVSYGTFDKLDPTYNFITNWMYEDQIYGMPSTANAQGIVYNKKVFEAAGITTLPKTPDEFIAALQAIKDKTDATPLYTNYAAEWTMGAWDAYIGGSATGSADFQNLVMPYQANPFTDRKDATGPYALYKILYDAANKGLIEDDYTTTDWEGCKGMINKGEIGCMVLGSWAVSQMQQAGDNGADIGYMSFPITVNGKQYASAGPDYCYGINVNASDDNKLASELFVKFMVEQSGFAYNEGGIPALRSDTNLPELYSAFDGIEFVVDTPAEAGKENVLSELNAESELNINQGGNKKIMEIVEHGANNDKSFDDIMADWNQAWTDAQDTVGVEVTK
jgi:ABC-type glycerol-3-phosphate transport system substrate-binding protein